jgi:LPXTG-site transpeptidase (sortase) family protein
MALRGRDAAPAGPRFALGDKSRRLAGILMAAGTISLVAGAAILLTGLAPMFMGRAEAAPPIPSGEWATVVAPSPSSAPAPAAVIRSPAAVPQALSGGPIDGVTFEISVPAIGYRAIVRQGVGSKVLALGPGHYPGTPWPGQPGNVGVAGHNNYWLSFNRLRAGDRVEIRTQHGLYVYEISGSRVVSPNDGTVLAPTNDNRLTLTTCYPLWTLAFATQRLVFTASEIGGVA